MSEYSRESQTLLLLDYLRQHPGLALSITYALLTLCGIFYSASFYQQFNIPILKLANISDLMVAGLSEPAALLMFSGGVLVGIFVDLSSVYFHKLQDDWRKKPKSFKRVLMLTVVFTPKKSESVMMMVLACFILYAFVFVSFFAEWHGNRIKQGHGEQVLMISNAADSEAKRLTLLGSTTHFLITYSQSDKKATLTPVDNIVRLNTLSTEAEK